MSHYIVLKNDKKICEGSASEVALKINASVKSVRVAGARLEILNGYQIIESENITRLDDDLIISLIEEGKTYEEISQIINYPLGGLKQFCIDRGYRKENIGHMVKKDVYYPKRWKMCPICKKWFANYVGEDWHYFKYDKKGNRIDICTYGCALKAGEFNMKPMRGAKYTRNF